MQVVSAETDLDLSARFVVVVDQDAEPVDLDEAILDFIEKIVERRHLAAAGKQAISSTARSAPHELRIA